MRAAAVGFLVAPLEIFGSFWVAAKSTYVHVVTSAIQYESFEPKAKYQEALGLEFSRISRKVSFSDASRLKSNIEIAKAEMAVPGRPASVQVFNEKVDPRPLSRNVGENGVVLTTTFEISDRGGCLAKQLLYLYEKKDENPEVKKIFEGRMTKCDVNAIADDAEDYQTESLHNSSRGLRHDTPDESIPERGHWPYGLKDQETHHAVIMHFPEFLSISEKRRSDRLFEKLKTAYKELQTELRRFDPVFLEANILIAKKWATDYEVEVIEVEGDPLKLAYKESAVVLLTSYFSPKTFIPSKIPFNFIPFMPIRSPSFEVYGQKITPQQDDCKVLQRLLLYRDSHSPDKMFELIVGQLEPCRRSRSVMTDLLEQDNADDPADGSRKSAFSCESSWSSSSSPSKNTKAALRNFFARLATLKQKAVATIPHGEPSSSPMPRDLSASSHSMRQQRHPARKEYGPPSSPSSPSSSSPWSASSHSMRQQQLPARKETGPSSSSSSSSLSSSPLSSSPWSASSHSMRQQQLPARKEYGPPSSSSSPSSSSPWSASSPSMRQQQLPARKEYGPPSSSSSPLSSSPWSASSHSMRQQQLPARKETGPPSSSSSSLSSSPWSASSPSMRQQQLPARKEYGPPSSSSSSSSPSSPSSSSSEIYSRNRAEPLSWVGRVHSSRSQKVTEV